MTIGIGIVTYNRLDLVKEAVTAVLKYTTGPYFLVVADDGSTDGTRDYLISEGITVVGDRNRGIAWNKNRALYALRTYTGVNTIIILEDDTLPVAYGWQDDWRQVVSKHGYATHAHPKVMDAVLVGQGTPEDPYGCTKITSQCSAVSRQALDTVGYFDTRFRGYGVEDGEWTTRLRGAGFGIVSIKKDGPALKANCMIAGGVRTLPAVSFRDNDSVRRNRELFERIRNDPIPRLPWRDDEERATLIADVEQALRTVPLLCRTSDGQGAGATADVYKVTISDRVRAPSLAKEPSRPAIYLHIADAEAGASAIQVALVRNRELLFNNGFIYPEGQSEARNGLIASGNGQILEDILQRSASMQAKKERSKESLLQMLREFPNKSIIFSSKGLENSSPENLAEFVSLVRAQDVDVKIVYYVRHLMDAALALYNLSLKSDGMSWDFFKFLQRYKSEYAQVIANLSKVVGEDNVIVRLYENDCPSLIADFFQIFLADFQAHPEVSALTPHSSKLERFLTADEVGVLQFANGLLAGVDRKLAREIFKGINEKLTSRPNVGEEHALVTPEELEALKRTNEPVLSYVNDFVKNRFQLRLMSDAISVGEKEPQRRTERDELFMTVLEATISRIKALPGSARESRHRLDRQ